MENEPDLAKPAKYSLWIGFLMGFGFAAYLGFHGEESDTSKSAAAPDQAHDRAPASDHPPKAGGQK